MSGDDIGVWYSYDGMTAGETVEVSMAISYVSEEGALRNLEAEQPAGTTFDDIRASARRMWNDDLSRISVEGGSLRDKVVFYTGLYHALIHPNILQDVDGAYPVMESDSIAYVPEGHNRYTVFSLWDTYRNLHQLLTLVYPERQTDMLNTMLAMYREHGWLPKWELYGRETYTMEGDPSISVIADSYLRGLRGFDTDLAWEAMLRGATAPGAENLMRPDADDYFSLGYVPLREQYDNSVSHASNITQPTMPSAASPQLQDGPIPPCLPSVRPDGTTTSIQNSVCFVRVCPTVRSSHRSIPAREKTLSLRPDFMKGTRGTIPSPFPTM